MAPISRRSVLLGLGATALPWSAAAQPPSVVVVGAGLAGLAAAHELAEAGFDVRVAEQSSRAGGRVKTVRGVFADDAWVDVGGQLSGAGYANFFYYASKFGLELVPASRFDAPTDTLLHLGGTLRRAADLRADPGSWPVPLADAEKRVAPHGLLGYYLRPIAAEIGTVEQVLDARFANYDAMSLRELLSKQGASAAALQMIDRYLNYNSIDTVSALSALRDAVRFLHAAGAPTLSIAGGNSALPEAFARALGGRIHYRAALSALRYSDEGAELQFETDQGTEVWEAQYVVIAIPFTALRKVRFDTDLPRHRRAIVDALPYTQIAQTYVQTRERFWQKDNTVSVLYSDGPLERVFNASQKMTSGRGLLINWLNGTGTRSIEGMDADEQTRFALREIRKIWPQSAAHIETSYANDWGKSYAGGAYAHYAKGQLTRFAREIPKPIACLHFAGEHTELVAPGMEGALTSGRRVAGEILGITRL